MNEQQAEALIEEIREWWQERRRSYAMGTQEHNREADQVERLIDRVRSLIVTPEPAEPAEEHF